MDIRLPRRSRLDTIPLAKIAKRICLMMDSPAAVSPRQLRDLQIEVKAAKKE